MPSTLATTTFLEVAHAPDLGTTLYFGHNVSESHLEFCGLVWRLFSEPRDAGRLVAVYALAGNSDWVVELDETDTGSAWQHWLGLFHGLSTWADWPALQLERDDRPTYNTYVPALPADELRQLTGLSVEALARMLGVSRVSYHNWLAGRGITPEKKGRLYKLLAVLWRAKERFGDDLGEWMLSPPAPGAAAPVRLLEEEKDDVVAALVTFRPALRSAPRMPTAGLYDQAADLSGVPLLRMATPPQLGWSASSERALAERERLLPVAEADDLPVSEFDQDDDRSVIGIDFT